MPDTTPKLFVLDTNVILHDNSCITQFEEHDVCIPMVVLEELDAFKKGNETVNFHAREFVRAIDAMDPAHLFNGGLDLGDDRGRFSIKTEHDTHAELPASFSRPTADNRILNTAFTLAQGENKQEVVLVTKDVNLRMKARSIGLKAEDYTSDHVKDPVALYSGHRRLEGIADEVIDTLYAAPFRISADKIELPTEEPLHPHEYLVLRNRSKSILCTYEADSNELRRIHNLNAFGISPRNAEQNFAIDALMNPDIPLITLSGKAGTGKTLLALAAALAQHNSYRQVFLARPVVPLSNRDLGFLPGDISSKLDPYMQPLFDNLNVIRGQFKEESVRQRTIQDMQEKDKLVISPLAYIRGRSLSNIFFIIDEAQNLTPKEVKTIITRAAEGTKMVFTGDIFQIDHPYLDSQSNGLSYLISRMRRQHLFAHINLEKGERSALSELASDIL